MSAQSNAFANYWRTIGRAIVTTIAGLRVTVKYLFSRPVTIEYPDVLPIIPDGWRGFHAFESDKCIKCRLCEKACPVGSISIDLEGKGKKAQLLRYEINNGTCLFCNLCCDACPTECLWMTDEWDRAGYRREDCTVRLEGRKPDDERKKKWPSMKTHPDRLAEQARAKAEKESTENEKAEKEPGEQAPPQKTSKPSEEPNE